MSSYYDTIGSAYRHLDVVEKLAALILVRDEWEERIENELFGPLIGNPVEGAEIIKKSFKILSERVDRMTSLDEPPDEFEVEEILVDFHSLAHRLGTMRVKYLDDEGDLHIAFDNPSPPQGKWVAYLSQLAELRAMFKSKGGEDGKG